MYFYGMYIVRNVSYVEIISNLQICNPIIKVERRRANIAVMKGYAVMMVW